jgi:diaminopimelate epimerase
LSVEFDKTDENHYENIWLCGPAEKVYEGMVDLSS